MVPVYLYQMVSGTPTSPTFVVNAHEPSEIECCFVCVFSKIFVSSHMYPENHEETRVIVDFTYGRFQDGELTLFPGLTNLLYKLND